MAVDAAAARELLEDLTETADVAVSGEMRGVDHNEHCARSEPGDFTGPGRRNMQRPPLTGADVRGDPVGWCNGTGCKYSTVSVRVTAGVPAIHNVKPSTSSQAAATAPPCAKPGAPM